VNDVQLARGQIQKVCALMWRKRRHLYFRDQIAHDIVFQHGIEPCFAADFVMILAPDLYPGLFESGIDRSYPSPKPYLGMSNRVLETLCPVRMTAPVTLLAEHDDDQLHRKVVGSHFPERVPATAFGIVPLIGPVGDQHEAPELVSLRRQQTGRGPVADISGDKPRPVTGLTDSRCNEIRETRVVHCAGVDVLALYLDSRGSGQIQNG
jgi:hypothetical protein